MTRIPVILMLSTALLLGGCDDDIPIQLPGGTPGSGGVVTAASYHGIWDGAYIGNPPGNPEQWATTFTALIHDSRMILVESNGQVWDAEYQPIGSATMRASDVRVHARNGIQTTRVLINGSIAGTDSLTLSYDLGTGVGLIQMNYGIDETAYNRSSSLAQLASVWSSVVDGESDRPVTTLAINDVGDVAVFDGGDSRECRFNGVIELIDAGRNLYKVSEFVVADGVEGACDVLTTVNIVDNEAPGGSRTEEVTNVFAGDGYSGLATLIPDQNTLLLAVTNGTDRAVKFELARQ